MQAWAFEKQNMNTKKFLATMMLPLAVASFSPTGLFAQGTQKQLKVGLGLINLQAKFFNDIKVGADYASKKAGVSLQGIDGNNYPTAPVNAVATLTQQHLDG